MKYNNDFRYDLLVGQNAENFLGELLQSKKIEVKLDKLAHKTGFIFVEFESRSKPSGIATTQADYWCYIIDGRGAIIVSTETMKQKAREAIKLRGEIRGGDSNTSRGVLVEIGGLLK